MLRSNLQWMRQGALLTAGGLAVFGGLIFLKKDTSAHASSSGEVLN
jgi:hypothetical protein